MYQCCCFGGGCRIFVEYLVIFLILLSSGGIVGSSYVIVSAAKWTMTCVSGNGPMYEFKFLYQSPSRDMSIVIVYGSFWPPCEPSE